MSAASCQNLRYLEASVRAVRRCNIVSIDVYKRHKVTTVLVESAVLSNTDFDSVTLLKNWGERR